MKRTLRQKIKDTIKEAYVLIKKDIKDAKWVIMIIIAYFAFTGSFLHSSCPMVMITGYPCPACGLTRAGVRLLHLDFAGAWHIHPFIYAAALLVCLSALNRYFLKGRIGKWVKWCALLVLGGMIVYYVWRMYMYFPGEPPMGYYGRSLLGGILKGVRPF